MISGETISAAHKGVDAIEFTPRCKLICACNNFINSKDITYGFMRWLKFIVFPKIFTEAEANRGLLDELKTEAQGILNWMIEGWRMLKASEDFIVTEEEAQTREEFMALANPLTLFVKKYVMTIQGPCTVSTAELFDLYYKQWAADMNVSDKISKINFGRQVAILVRQMRPGVKQKRGADSTQFIIPAPKAVTPSENDAESWRAL